MGALGHLDGRNSRRTDEERYRLPVTSCTVILAALRWLLNQRMSGSFMAKTEVNRMLAAAAEACEDKKGEDIRILALDPAESGLTDYFLICSGNSDRQNVAITDEIELRLKREFGTYPNGVEGRRQGEWILMDYVDFIVHVFSAEKRAFYGLERLRKSATVLSVADLNAEIKEAIAAGRKKNPKPAAAKKAVRKGVSTAGSVKKAAKKVVAKKAAKKAVKKAKTPRA
jgi:ribosome-associated protein